MTLYITTRKSDGVHEIRQLIGPAGIDIAIYAHTIRGLVMLQYASYMKEYADSALRHSYKQLEYKPDTDSLPREVESPVEPLKRCGKTVYIPLYTDKPIPNPDDIHFQEGDDID